MSATTPQYSASIAYHAEAAAQIAGAVNSNVRLVGTPVPLCFERGEGAYLWDVDGNRFVDYMLGMGPTILGHAPPAVTRAVAESLATGQMLGGQHRAEAELARMTRALVPGADLVRFAMTGSEVVQAALRVSRAFTGRRKFIKFEGQYHGWFDNVLISHAPPLPADNNANLPLVSPPHLETRGQSPSVTQDVVILPWNNLDAVAAVLDQDDHDIAALITEPMMCNTGAIPPAPGFLQGLRDLCTRHGVVLIFDEVITGFRIALGGGQQRFGVTADLATFAKAMAGGFPMAALTGTRDLMEMFGTGAVNHSGTYNSSVPMVAASIATLTELTRDNGAALARVEQNGQCLIDGLRRAAQDADENLTVTGFGGVFNTTFGPVPTDYRSYKRGDLARQQAFLRGLVGLGIRPIPRGTWFVSAAHSADDIDETIAAAATVLRQLRDQ